MKNIITYTLGISHLDDTAQNMMTNEIYWLSIDSKSDINNIVNQLVKSNNNKNYLINISSELNNYINNNNEKEYHKNSKQMFFKRFNKEKLDYKKYINCIKSQKNSLAILYIPQNDLNYLTNDNVHKLLKKIKLAAIKFNCSVCFISKNPDLIKLSELLSGKFRILSGFSSLSTVDLGYEYKIHYWLTQSSILSNLAINLQYQHDNFTLDTKSRNTITYRSDENIYYVHKNIIDDKILHSDNWNLINTNHELVEIAEKSYSATLVFSINKIVEIDELAEKIHLIRSTRGNNLKIAIIESQPCIRFSDERLLLACGANLVVHNGTSLAYLFSLLESIQSQVFSKILLNDVKCLIDGMKPLRIKGIISSNVFGDSVNILLQNGLLPIDGKGLLFIFEPMKGLQPEQAFTLCKIRRYGDIITVHDDKIYLFLFSCRLTDEHSALSNIFQLPVENIFQRKATYSRDKDIMQHLKPLLNNTHSAEIAGIKPILNNSSTSIAPEPSVYRPKPITLKFR